jgi:hypothetical protein
MYGITQPQVMVPAIMDATSFHVTRDHSCHEVPSLHRMPAGTRMSSDAEQHEPDLVGAAMTGRGTERAA